MTDPGTTPMESMPPHTRRWIRFGWLLATPIAAALLLVAALPARPSRDLPPAARGGCDHTPGPDGSSACPHGVDANGGCTMSAGGDSATNFSSQALPGRVLAWALPDGWVEEPGGGGLRIATLRPPGPGKVDISVVALPGTAGGELANVNRWREQIGLPPLKETELNSQRTQVKAPAGSMSVFDMDHSGRAGGRLTVGMIKAGAHTWFIKMTGDRVAVLRTRPSFLSLLKSVRASEGASVEVPA